ncbi:unnamed protein product [Acanthoscelides obtectus]|uniref:histone deacetylase n=1 Tax=Acanthoscelides obtectus TaxID=200917 RepID=A0A9P0K387_ACAOB|nr:unnamed protein product [Acanthoscelides obtectus]CAK1622696.1 Histone deacetylase 4 [Acanthoscelides obtectus]
MGDQDRGAPERELERQILQIKKQHQIQHQILLQQFQQQQQHLVEQHEQQLRQHLKEFWDRQKQLQELRQREQLEALRKKEKHEESAVASTEVKQKLQSFLRQRASGGKASRPENSCWSEGMDTSSESSTTNNDFPLRKTASEPNLLKVRLKQRVMERRCSPMSKRLPPSLKKKLLSSCLPPSESPPQQEPPKELSPPCGGGDLLEERRRHAALFSSPSMPNISLAAAAAAAAASHHHHGGLAPPPDLSEAAVRAACTARLGMPLTGQMLPGTLPFYPSLPAIDSEQELTAAHHHAAAAQAAAQAAVAASGGPNCSSISAISTLDTISELQEPHTASGRGVIRPLGRTQSSPLPLGHPLLGGVAAAAAAAAAAAQAVAQVPPPPPERTKPTLDAPPSPGEQEQRDLELRANESRRYAL